LKKPSRVVGRFLLGSSRKSPAAAAKVWFGTHQLFQLARFAKVEHRLAVLKNAPRYRKC